MKYFIVNNLHTFQESMIIFKGDSDEELIHFTKGIVKENGDEDYSILGISDAEEYIEEYCDNLTLHNEQSFWDSLGDIPVNEDGELEEDFVIFDEGTDREDIWDWFEKEFDTQIGGKYI